MRTVFHALALLAWSSMAHAEIVYVDIDATGANDGTSWADAYVDLQDALVGAWWSEEIWVAEGVYRPTSGSDRSVSFRLPNLVGLYGGFVGTEGSRDARDPIAHPTILSGAIGIPDRDDNSFHVVTGTDLDVGTVISGFTIRDGYAANAGTVGAGMFIQRSDLLVEQVVLENNWARDGGGVYLTGGDSTVFREVVFRGNHATSTWSGGGGANFVSASVLVEGAAFVSNTAETDGGAIVNSGRLTLINALFWDNEARGRHGGAVSSFRGLELINVTVARNWAGSAGGGIYLRSAETSTIMNSILYGNAVLELPIPGNPQLDGGDLVIGHSLLQGSGGDAASWPGVVAVDAGGNIDGDPAFFDLHGGDLQLTSTSVAINAGDDAAMPPSIEVDLAGSERFVGEAIDMGCYEYQHTVKIDDEGEVPLAPELGQYLYASPNPFNPSTTIYYGVTQPGHVELTVYDLAGRRVRTLVSGHVTAGDHEVGWDGRDESSRRVASGVYLYRLTADEFMETKRMVLLK